MPWHEVSVVEQRLEFVHLAQQQGVSLAELCRRFGISRVTGYKWLERAESGQGLTDRSRRPQSSPRRTPEQIAEQVLALRRQHPAWGGRKLAHRLMRLGFEEVPAPSTITHILRRHGLISSEQSAAATPWQRFEHAAPNDLWQIDFKGDFAAGNRRCHPLTVLDDHSRYNLILQACSSQNTPEVRSHLTRGFQRYGLPVRINADHGQPWGSPAAEHGLSQLSIWLIRLGIRLSFSGIRHPQTNGKDERFHRSLKAEVLHNQAFQSLDQAQRAFNRWRPVYNQQRPHEGIGYAVPADRYQPSPRRFPGKLPPIEYGPDDQVAVVGWNGQVRFKGRRLKVSNALKDLPIALRPSASRDGHYDLYFCHHRFAHIDLHKA